MSFESEPLLAANISLGDELTIAIQDNSIEPSPESASSSSPDLTGQSPYTILPPILFYAIGNAMVLLSFQQTLLLSACSTILTDPTFSTCSIDKSVQQLASKYSVFYSYATNIGCLLTTKFLMFYAQTHPKIIIFLSSFGMVGLITAYSKPKLMFMALMHIIHGFFGTFTVINTIGAQSALVVPSKKVIARYEALVFGSSMLAPFIGGVLQRYNIVYPVSISFFAFCIISLKFIGPIPIKQTTEPSVVSTSDLIPIPYNWLIIYAFLSTTIAALPFIVFYTALQFQWDAQGMISYNHLYRCWNLCPVHWCDSYIVSHHYT